ncbi:MAG: MlaD family protein [candidate division Zixibacteria bacterium]|nr:MlaD family protein [candidate division Zixibacteria bacterium]
MKRSIRVKWGELRVGLLITVAIAVMLWASFSGSGTSIFDTKTGYMGYLSNVNGLVSGAPVWIAGVEVGNVTHIKFVNLDSARQIEIRLRVKKSITNMITTDAGMKLGTIGFLGDKYIEIVPGTLTKPRLEPGSVIPTVPGADLAAMLAEGQKAMEHAHDLSDNLTDLTGKLRRGEGTAGQMFTNDTLFHEMTKMVSAMTVLIEEMQKSQKQITSSIKDVARNLDTITTQINSNRGTVGKLIADPGLYNNLHSSAGRIDSILARVERGEGSAGALVKDDSLYIEIRDLVLRVENLVSDIEKNPRKYFKFSVF